MNKPEWAQGKFWLGDNVRLIGIPEHYAYHKHLQEFLERKIRGHINKVSLSLYDDGSGIHIGEYWIAWKGELTGLYLASLIEPSLERIGDERKRSKVKKAR